MGDLHENVAHISTISRSSPHLFFSLFLLTWNIIFTLVGVDINKEDPLAAETVQRKIRLFHTSVSVFPSFCLVILCSKCVFMKCITKLPFHKMRATFLYNMAFIFMGTLYLWGDNLPILICSGMDSTTDKDVCIEQSSVILGISLLLHTTLYVAGIFNLKPTDIPTFPVTGRIRKAYQSILKLVALTIFLDQTFSTVVRFITRIDIEIDESPNCGCVGNTTNCSSEMEIEGFLAGLSMIMLLIFFGLVVKNRKDYCSCWWIKRNLMRRQCCCHWCENILIFIVYLLVIGFMVIYTLADNRWLWVCTSVSMSDPTTARLEMLRTSLSFSLLWIVLYLVVILIPGLVIARNKTIFFTENDYLSVLATKEKGEWVCKDPQVNTSCVRGLGQNDNTDQTYSTDMVVEESCGSVSITLPIEEDITCYQGLCYCRRCQRESSTSDNDDGASCASYLQDTCGWIVECSSCRTQTTQDEKMIMFTYIGKRENFKRLTLSQDGTVHLSDVQEHERPRGTTAYVIQKPNTSTESAIDSLKTTPPCAPAEYAERQF